ncbi:H/ACA ribonucleoprotein complex non-core subunit NAF1 [Abortiporus biennis]
MNSENYFKVPSHIPQDLLLIHDLVGDIPTIPIVQHKTPPPTKVSLSESKKVDNYDDEASSNDGDDDADSEKEVEDNILGGLADDEEEPKPSIAPSDSTSDSDSSDSDSDSDIPQRKRNLNGSSTINDNLDDDGGDDEEGGGGVNNVNQLRTKNEVSEPPIIIPTMEEIEGNEELEKVGEIMSIIDKVVIVKGNASHIANRASERALDSETLLVFEDRKVFGYVYETFGPTHQPLYQVRFSKDYPLDPEKVKISREVFHVPARSNFVFVSQLKTIKGSDASNAHDEEPGEEELDFSDDEQERAHKKALEQRRIGSRHGTPAPSTMQDHEMGISEDMYGSGTYNHATYNDMDFGAGPSRPQPIPYDDPYSDSYGLTEDPSPSGSSINANMEAGYVPPAPPVRSLGMNDRPLRGRGRGKGPMRDGGSGRQEGSAPIRGRGRDRDRRRHERGRGRGRGRGGGGGGSEGHSVSGCGGEISSRQGSFSEEYDHQTSRPLSPTSLAIARATGQFSDGSMFASSTSGDGDGQTGYSPVSPTDASWGYASYGTQQQGNDYNSFGYQQSYAVQPHINPRFASAFAYNFGFTQPQAGNNGYGDYAGGYSAGTTDTSGASWNDEWGGSNSQGPAAAPPSDPTSGGGS